MKLSQRIEAFSTLGSFLQKFLLQSAFQPEEVLNNAHVDRLNAAIDQAYFQNPWFTSENVRFSLAAIASNLNRQKLSTWIRLYPQIKDNNSGKRTFAIIMAGNIPLVGFHDFLSVLISGHRICAKVSSKDSVLLKAISELLADIHPDFDSLIEIKEGKIENFDAVIATGSDNSSRYFDYYFRNYPSLIRSNRTSVAILDGHESDEKLQALAKDIFTYFGLGCRNVSKIYVPDSYDFSKLFENTKAYTDLINHNKYANNYEYNKAVYLVNREPHLDNGYLILKEDKNLFSPVSVLFYEQYTSIPTLKRHLSGFTDKIQCIVTDQSTFTERTGFGQAQNPALNDYADGADTIQFILETEKQISGTT